MSFKRVNLYYLYTSSKLNITEYRLYEKVLSNREIVSNLGEREKDSLSILVDLLINDGCSVLELDNFYYSYIIPHIGKEFDILKIDQTKVLNIELKSENVGLDRIKSQLVRNYHYLKYLGKNLSLFTFVSDTKTFYKLNEKEELVLINKEEVVTKIKEFASDDYPDIDKLFKTSDYLVSPNVNSQKFIKGQYFLTTQQEYIKNKLFQTIKDKNVFKITGEAGTGKTLLLFDIAVNLAKENKVVIINCNKANKLHNEISNHFEGLTIVSQDELIANPKILTNTKYILLDESQRMSLKTWSMVLKEIYNKNKVIFSLDPKQVLTKEEIKANYNSLIDKLEPYKFKLSNRIRINNSITNFTYRLFDLSLLKYNLDLENVNLHYASTPEELNRYFDLYKDEFIYIKIPNTNYKCEEICSVSIGDVVGKDYENVLMIMDTNYYYSNNKLSSKDSIKNDYLYLKILYQGLSRTREKLTLIVYRNKKLFKEILKNIK